MSAEYKAYRHRKVISMRSLRPSLRLLHLLILPLLICIIGLVSAVTKGLPSRPATKQVPKVAQAAKVAKVAVVEAPTAGARAISSPSTPYQARKLCELSDEAIDESSGLGASRRYPGYLWTHNDSGDKPRLFLISPQGKTVATVSLPGAEAKDWEDMAVAGTGQEAWVYVGDMGDNLANRSNIVVYRFHEPALNLQSTPETIAVSWERMTLTYSDGPHDAETLLATPAGDLIIVTKSLGPSLIFKTPQPFTKDATQKMARVGQYQFSGDSWRSLLATGGDLSPDGKRFIVRTYTEAYQWALPAASPWTAVWKLAPQKIALPDTKQGEAICYNVDGKDLFITSEKRPTPLYQLAPSGKA